jgi:integrase
MATFVRREARGRTVYLARIRRKGQPPLAQTFERLTDAKAWASRMEAQISENRAVPGRAARKTTVADVIQRYQKGVLPQKRWSTSRNQVKQLEWWREQIGHLTLADITPAIVSRCRDTLAEGHTPATVKRYLAVLSHLFTTAVREWQLIDRNPVSLVAKPVEARGRVRFLSESELQRLLEGCKASRSEYLYPLVLLALSTGARRGNCWN